MYTEVIYHLHPIPMYIVHVATEVAPISKVGGLADVIQGLSKQCSLEGHQVEIIIPKYRSMHKDLCTHIEKDPRSLSFKINNSKVEAGVWHVAADKMNVTMIESPEDNSYFDRDYIYGYPDDNERFTYFCKAVLEYLAQFKKKPDVVHIHDWPTALIAPLHQLYYKEKGVKIGKIVYTIHNLDHQGITPPSLLQPLGAAANNPLLIDTLKDPEEPHLINLMRGGIECSDIITTVSPTYRKEILNQEYSKRLYETLVKNQHKLFGIINGIDTDFWNPQTDRYLKAHYSMENLDDDNHLNHMMASKKKNRELLSSRLGLNLSKTPLVVSITRLVPQKGPELISHALHHTLQKKGQFVLLGSTHSPDMEEMFTDLKLKFVENRDVAICLNKDEEIAHLIYSSADMIVVPSIYEPCGLTQIIAMRYATVPIVRKTGGLADTVFDIETSTIPIENRNGFTFDYPDTEGVNWGLDRALTCFSKDKAKWRGIIKNESHQDLSWKKPAQEYLKLYTR